MIISAGKRALSIRGWPRFSCKFLALVFLVSFFAAGVRATIGYGISLDQPEKHLFHVTMTIPDVHGQTLVQMPAWNATYQIRDFAYRIQYLVATDESGQRLPSGKLDKQTWRITGNGKITVAYAISWDESSPFSSQINSVHAFLNLAEVLLYIPERRGEDVELVFSGVPENWFIASAFSRVEILIAGSVELLMAKAPGYDAMVDTPVELGPVQTFDLPDISPPVHVAVHGENWNKQELTESLSKIVRYETQLMGGAPYSEYTFIFHIGQGSNGGGGGMEHSNSTAIGAGSTTGAISIAAHEFFHLWNVKRMRPQTLEPVDYTKEMYTRALWFAEGVTSTYASFTEVRTGLWTPDRFYADIAAQISELQSRPARLWQSVEESSLDAWLEKYLQYNQPEYSISYYNKGQIDGLLLDILIRDATDNKKSLDDVMCSMNDNFAKKGRFYNDSADIEATAEAVAGVSFHDFFSKYVAGTVEIPYAGILAKAGLGLTTSQSPHATQEFHVAELNNATEKQRRIRDGMLKGTTN
jgi:predicted metalloprotease with PDZ domain